MRRIHDARRPDLIEAVAAGGLVPEHEIHYSRHDGTRVILDIAGCVTRDGAGRPIAFVFIGRDITEEKRLEEQLYQSRKLEALGHLAGEIARDLETNFSVISRQGGLLLSGPAPGRQECGRPSKR